MSETTSLQLTLPIMQTQTNRRNCPEHFIEGHHVRLNDLRSTAERRGLKNQYLYKEDVPEYPRPELCVSHLKHDTERRGLCGIRKDRGSSDPRGGSSDPRHLSLVWWSLAVGPEEMRAAETRLLEETYPDRMEEQAAEQESFLWKFASSPAFKRRSRLGSYRFRFPLEEVLTAYSEQFCSGAPPIMRVFKTSLYKQEVQYSVLVHSPANQELFSRFPLLPRDDPDAVCAYRDGRFIWRPEAMCKTHSYELIQRPDQMDARGPMRHPEFYVWDHVAVALHVDRQVLRFDPDQLRGNLRFCWRDNRTIIPRTHFDHFCRAHSLLRRLWPRHSWLEKEPPLRPT